MVLKVTVREDNEGECHDIHCDKLYYFDCSYAKEPQLLARHDDKTIKFNNKTICDDEDNIIEGSVGDVVLDAEGLCLGMRIGLIGFGMVGVQIYSSLVVRGWVKVFEGLFLKNEVISGGLKERGLEGRLTCLMVTATLARRDKYEMPRYREGLFKPSLVKNDGQLNFKEHAVIV